MQYQVYTEAVTEYCWPVEAESEAEARLKVQAAISPDESEEFSPEATCHGTERIVRVEANNEGV